MKPIIKVENLSKQYRLGTIGVGTLRQDVSRWIHKVRGKEDPYLKIGESNDRTKKGKSDLVWALKDINFEVMPGEILGIIGKNGAGKSTLLKILSKVTGPTTGSISYDGRIGSLLEVGTGFHPELTGRENIFLNGAILGMTKHEIRSKLDEIIDFSGCERYIDTPVKRYSSGMTVRLGFAVAAHLEPEILVVDEVLAVGDAEFQKKAIGKMQDVSREDGRTVLFVSHNIGAIRSLCNKGIVLENGRITIDSIAEDAIQTYLSIEENNSRSYFYPHDNAVKEIKVEFINREICLRVKYDSKKEISKPNLGFVVYDSLSTPLFGTNPVNLGISDFGEPRMQGEISVIISYPLLVDGQYPISIWFSDGIQVSEEDTIFQKEKCVTLNISGMNGMFIQKNISAEGIIIPVLKYEFKTTQ